MNPVSKQQGWVHRNPADLGLDEPNKVGSRQTQQDWVSTEPSNWVRRNPTRLGSSEPKLGSTRPSRVRQNPARNPTLLGLGKPRQASLVETQGRKEGKRKKEGEEEGLGGFGSRSENISTSPPSASATPPSPARASEAHCSVSALFLEAGKSPQIQALFFSSFDPAPLWNWPSSLSITLIPFSVAKEPKRRHSDHVFGMAEPANFYCQRGSIVFSEMEADAGTPRS
ncbi:hypothetical protein SLEP1_g57017 [Rubroshorea leprosula]|uniref:Uncharacterized protein n=1 Tax=Rubroshorea leprosula TaxID=152421 RepID=A0AAV5MK75_9ROSI|nr:hypothetical protein SLEP1_g57017 [Rubroshorea leprosula]